LTAPRHPCYGTLTIVTDSFPADMDLQSAQDPL
jgi:hypothetical protein